jgi:predicted DNA binding CopG/RHH family protein
MTKPYPEGIELDAEEQEYENAFDEFVPAPESERLSLIAAAKTGRRPLSIRMDSADIVALKRLAAREGLPY